MLATLLGEVVQLVVRLVAATTSWLLCSGRGRVDVLWSSSIRAQDFISCARMTSSAWTTSGNSVQLLGTARLENMNLQEGMCASSKLFEKSALVHVEYEQSTRCCAQRVNSCALAA